VADGNRSGNGNGTGGGAATSESAATGAARAEEVVARSLEQTRRWINQRRLSAG
jgi:hypothetical protein